MQRSNNPNNGQRRRDLPSENIRDPEKWDLSSGRYDRDLGPTLGRLGFVTRVCEPHPRAIRHLKVHRQGMMLTIDRVLSIECTG
jgi:hypothetical protein